MEDEEEFSEYEDHILFVESDSSDWPSASSKTAHEPLATGPVRPQPATGRNTIFSMGLMLYDMVVCLIHHIVKM